MLRQSLILMFYLSFNGVNDDLICFFNLSYSREIFYFFNGDNILSTNEGLSLILVGVIIFNLAD